MNIVCSKRKLKTSKLHTMYVTHIPRNKKNRIIIITSRNKFK